MRLIPPTWWGARTIVRTDGAPGLPLLWHIPRICRRPPSRAMRRASSHQLFDRPGAPLEGKRGPAGSLEAGLTHIPGICRRSANLQALSDHITSPGSDTNRMRGILSFTNKAAMWVRVGRGPAKAPPHKQRKQRIACNASL